jgi:CheY-like chemotaxis protein
MSSRNLEILLVEDSEDDVLLTEEALRHGRKAKGLHVVGDGEAAMDYLRQQYAEESPPDLVILDLNLPKRGGMEVLEELKEDPIFRSLPVVVLTTSSSEHDIARAYDSQVNAYLTKPIDVDDFIGMVRMIEAFYLRTVSLPLSQ